MSVAVLQRSLWRMLRGRCTWPGRLSFRIRTCLQTSHGFNVFGDSILSEDANLEARDERYAVIIAPRFRASDEP